MKVKVSEGFWQSFELLEVPYGAMIACSGLPITVGQETSLSQKDYLGVWQAYSDLVPDIGAAIIKMATGFQRDLYPTTVLAAYHAPNYFEAIQRMIKYKTLCPPEKLMMKAVGDTAEIELSSSGNQEIPALLSGSTLAFLLELGRKGTGKLIKANSLELTLSTENPAILEQFFGCRVKVNGQRNCLVIDKKKLGEVFHSYNQDLLTLLSPALDQELTSCQKKTEFRLVVDWFIKRNLSGNSLNPDQLAKELGVTKRTLQRKLQAEGTTFNLEVQKIRQELATVYLREQTYSNQEIAFMLGYNDHNSFYRAFKVWQGKTPSEWYQLNR